MVNLAIKHKIFLDNLVKNLSKINEDRDSVKFILSEPHLYRNNHHNEMKLCDLLVGFYDNSGLAVELKSSWEKRNKALAQLHNGYLLLESWGLQPIRKKIVVYGQGNYEFEEYISEDRVISYY